MPHFHQRLSGEGADRSSLNDDHSDALVKNVATNCSDTIVAIHIAGIRLVDQWIDHENVTVVIFARLPSQDSGRALVEILYGNVSPSGKLPYTAARNESDYETLRHNGKGKSSKFPQEIALRLVLFHFRALQSFRQLHRYHTPGRPEQRPILPGGNPAIWENIVTATARVTNTGDVDAAGAAQLYVGVPGMKPPIRQLDLARRDLSGTSKHKTGFIYIGPTKHIKVYLHVAITYTL
ncbi:uncharacterized protein Z518_06853 [Rhinocladiella mackenziei CBS 650.93]|uniref:beta-glucosidase n=1 Tax=Rhinocladiella mackenziei CBS 650.93 TaxID=1442369 RepID=A0A0D2IJ50_9EURO|nr:uncharacterized protein Z518_06853 [Rhinocladiella mackenziei CBS 650.93]KIX03301.1 hypothetical protein Z518_06853 [Rhinocladiella mackenziei CBS 650.93]